MKDIIRMNQLAGIITEGQAKKMMTILNEEEVDEMATLNEANPDVTKFKNYLNKKSFGMEVLDEPGPNIYFEFWTPAGSQAFEDLLNKLSLKFKKNTERDGGKLVTMYYVDKASAKQLFGK
jgi:hypothetical protein